MNIRLPQDSPLLARDFVYGVATSSFQIEGGAGDRLKCIWDTFCNQRGKIFDGSNGITACDHVNRWQEDVALMRTLGVDAYRLSVSWPRVLREDGAIHRPGLDFYLRLLDGLLDAGIAPFVTLYHWDLPQHLEDAGGWLERDTAYRFRDYVDVVSRAFGDRVRAWATLNEPYCSAHLGYATGAHAPGLSGAQFGIKAAHHLLLAHGLAMPVLEANCPGAQNGIVLNFSPTYPASDSEADVRAAGRANALFNQWYFRPVLLGEYPDIIADLAPDEAPDVHDGDMDVICRPIDYLGVNYYTRAVYRADGDRGFDTVPPTGPLTDMGWEVFPQGLTDLLVRLDREYDLPPVYITENGIAIADTMTDGRVEDPARIEYLQRHLEALDAAARQGVDIRGYFYWSLMDNFEWAEGYSKRFGLVHVDFDDQRRTVKASGEAFRDFLARRSGPPGAA